MRPYRRKEHMNTVVSGWLADVYPDPREGLVVWLYESARQGADGKMVAGRRLRLRQMFQVTFFISGSPERLRAVWQFLQSLDPAIKMARVERPELSDRPAFTTMSICVPHPVQEQGLVQKLSEAFQDLVFYNVNIPLPLRYAAQTGILPLASARAVVSEDGWIQEIEGKKHGNIWMPASYPRVMHLMPDIEPRLGFPRHMHVSVGGKAYHFPVEPARPLLVNLAALLQRHDPDLLLTAWGDGHSEYAGFLYYLSELAAKVGIRLPLHREPEEEAGHNQTWPSALQGMILAGRWHVDMFNSPIFYLGGMREVYQVASWTGLPVQQAARMIREDWNLALKTQFNLNRGTLVPWYPPIKQDLVHEVDGPCSVIFFPANQDLSNERTSPAQAFIPFWR